jgi:hypothetical protein
MPPFASNAPPRRRLRPTLEGQGLQRRAAGGGHRAFHAGEPVGQPAGDAGAAGAGRAPIAVAVDAPPEAIVARIVAALAPSGTIAAPGR